MTIRHYAWMGLLASIIFWTTYLIMSALRPEYNFLTKAISELGSWDAPNLWAWNCLGYIIPGLLIAGFAIGLNKELCVDKPWSIPFLGIFGSGLLMSLSGVFPGDFNDRQSISMLLHTLSSFGSYILFLIGAFTYVSYLKKNPNWKSSVMLGQVLVYGTILFGSWPFIFPHYPAAGQRVIFFLYFFWMGWYAFRLLKITNPK